MTLSVVIPNFNHGALLPRAITALLRQRCLPSEIIIVDDGSTDHSIAVIQSFQKQSNIIKLIRHDKNRGAPAALNTGLNAATGDFIYFAAADDFSLPDLFATAVPALKANGRAAFFCGVSVLVNPEGGIVGFRPFMTPADGAAYLSPGDVRRILSSSDNWAVGSTVIFRRQRLLEAGGFDEAMGALCDGILVRRLALEDGFCFDPIIGAAWEVYPESLSARAALSVSESLRLIETATNEVKVNFPRDVRASYAEVLNRRLRFNMARLCLVFERDKINVANLGAMLKLDKADLAALRMLSCLPVGRKGAILFWLSLRLRPYGLTALCKGWWRAIKLNWDGRSALEGELRDAQRAAHPG